MVGGYAVIALTGQFYRVFVGSLDVVTRGMIQQYSMVLFLFGCDLSLFIFIIRGKEIGNKVLSVLKCKMSGTTGNTVESFPIQSLNARKTVRK